MPHANGGSSPTPPCAHLSHNNNHHESAPLDRIDHGWSRTTTQAAPHDPSSRQRQRTIRNRRFAYLHQTLLASDYFSPQVMHLRNPILFKSAFPEVEGPPRPAGSAAEYPSNGVIASLFDAMDHERAVEVEREAEGRVGEVESESESDEEQGSGVEEEAQARDSHIGERLPNEAVDGMDQDQPAAGGGEQGAAERMAELIRTMAERWLDGFDAEFFDYSQVDTNAEYDNVTQVNQDAQDDWFEDNDSNEDVQCTDTGELDY